MIRVAANLVLTAIVVVPMILWRAPTWAWWGVGVLAWLVLVSADRLSEDG